MRLTGDNSLTIIITMGNRFSLAALLLLVSCADVPGFFLSDPTDQPASVQEKPAVFAEELSPTVFRVRAPRAAVWKALLKVLIKNYNFSIVDRGNAVVTTEWDRFYLDGVLYRNKLSIHMQAINWQATEVNVFNNVERLDGTPNSLSTGRWLPDQDRSQEIQRIVSNVVVSMGRPPPTFSSR